MSKAFYEFLMRRVEQLDEKIISQLHPSDVWVGTVSTGPSWFFSRESVRKISEGLAYSESQHVPEDETVNHVFDQFEKIYPDLNKEWPKQ